MKTGKMIRWTLLLVSLCVSLWQAPAIIHAIDGARGASGGGGGFPDLSQLTGQGGIPTLPGLAGAQPTGDAKASQQELAALQAALAARNINQKDADKDTRKDPDELVVFSPDGKKLTEAQKQKLLRDAARQRPAPRPAS